jgi:adenylosuccinate lyase
VRTWTLKLRNSFAAGLGLRAAPITTQVIQRDLHAEFIGTLALIGASVERWATEFRHLQAN